MTRVSAHGEVLPLEGQFPLGGKDRGGWSGPHEEPVSGASPSRVKFARPAEGAMLVVLEGRGAEGGEEPEGRLERGGRAMRPQREEEERRGRAMEEEERKKKIKERKNQGKNKIGGKSKSKKHQ